MGPTELRTSWRAEHMVTIFNGKVKLPEDYFHKVPVMPLKYGLGHPTDRTPLPVHLIPKNPSSAR